MFVTLMFYLLSFYLSNIQTFAFTKMQCKTKSLRLDISFPIMHFKVLQKTHLYTSQKIVRIDSDCIMHNFNNALHVWWNGRTYLYF